MNENVIFIFAIAVVIAAGIGVYGFEYNAESNKPPVTTIPLSSTLSSTTTSTSSTLAPTTTATAPDVPETSVTRQTTTSTTTTKTISSTTTTINPNFARFTGKGYRQAYMDVQYFCPSCVPAVVATLSKEPGVLSKSLNYRQKMSWVIYDPSRVSVERVLELAGASGGAKLLNDTVI